MIYNKLVSPHSTTSYVDIWRLLNPNTLDYTHKRTTNNITSQSRIDFFLILINHVSSATIESHSINSNHKTTTLLIQLPMNRLESKYGCSIKTEHFKLLSSPPQDAITNYNNIIKQTLSDNKISDIQSDLTNITHNKNKVNRIFKKTIIKAAKQALPITRYTTSSNTFNTNLTIHPSIKKMHKHLVTLRNAQKQLRMSKFLSPHTMTQLKTIHNLDLNIYKEENQDNLNDKTKQQIMSKNPCSCYSTQTNPQIHCSIKRIQTFLKRTKKLRLKHVLTTRLTQVAYNQKRFIQQVLEKSKQKFSLNFIENKATGQLTTKPTEIKEIITNHYQQLFTEPDHMITERDIKNNNQWARYFQVHDQNNSHFSNVMDPFTLQELEEIINDKNNQSAPGPDQLTYEHFKYIQDTSTLNVLLKLLNNALEHNIWPKENNVATIILLLKKDHYSGSPKELRPITLLQTIRKLLTSLITKRLTTIINQNNLLKGHNFGFTAGRSTNDAINIFRNTIDLANIKQKQFFALLLDVQAAYDTVPEIAIQMSLQRIGAPPSLIQLIQLLNKHRSIQIHTAAGLTDSFTPTLGLPQGDIISPLLWNIFYDPLLCELDQTDGYTFSDNLKLPKIAFADDLTTIAEDIGAIIQQANIVTSYLDLFQMKINVSKTILMTNLSIQDLSTLDLSQLKIYDEPITDIRHKTQLTRFLGVFLTGDGSHTQTYNHARDQLTNLLNIMRTKHCPGPLSTYLVNTVLIPILSYRLQVSPVNTGQLHEINVNIRNFVKNKHHYKYIPNLLLYDRHIGIGLQDFKSILDQRQISNALVIQRNQNITGHIQRYMSEVITTKLQLNYNIISHPINRELRPNPFILHISNILFDYDLQLRTITENSAENMATKLFPDSYNSYHKLYKRLNLKDLNDITLKPNNNSTPIQIQSFQQIFDNLPTAKQNWKIFTEYKQKNITPNFWQALIHLYVPYEETIPQNVINPDHIFSIRKNSTGWFNTTPINTEVTQQLRIYDHLSVYTDGSLQDSDLLGSAAIVLDSEDQVISTITAKSTPYLISSTKPELHAISSALTTIPKETKTTIYTDSKTSINNITKSMNPNLQDRAFLKMNNHMTLTSIQHELSKFLTPVTIKHVKAHIGTHGNELADKAAKQAAIDPLIPQTLPYIHPDIAGLPQNTFLHFAGTLVDQYPTKYIKHYNQNIDSSKTDEYLKAKLQKSFNDVEPTEINWQLTKQQASLSDRKSNFLDATLFIEQKFRLNLLTNQLPLNDRLFNQSISQTPYCPSCTNNTHKETILHFFQCPNTIDQIDILTSTTIEIIHKRKPKQLKTKPIPWNQIVQELLHFNTHALFFRGYIKHEDIEILQSRTQNTEYPLNKQETILLLLCIQDAWLSAFYKHIWIPRSLISKHSINKAKRHKPSNQSSQPNDTQQEQDRARPDPEPPPLTRSFPLASRTRGTPPRRKRTTAEITPHKPIRLIKRIRHKTPKRHTQHHTPNYPKRKFQFTPTKQPLKQAKQSNMINSSNFSPSYAPKDPSQLSHAQPKPNPPINQTLEIELEDPFIEESSTPPSKPPNSFLARLL